MAFKVGDIVQLKSGGPKMTVTDPNGYDEKVHTSWFAGSKHENGRFPSAALQIPTEDKK